MLLLGAILGSGGAILAGKSILRRRGMESDDLESVMREIRRRRLLEGEENGKEE